MLIVKALILKILDPLRITETETFTALGKTWTFRKIGCVVYMDAPSDSTNVVAGYNSIGILPESMRPDVQQRLAVGNGYNLNAFLEITTSGVVRMYSGVASSAARNCSFSTAFISGGGVLLNRLFCHRKVVGVC